MSETIFTLPAFAKINLFLRVIGRRADGYHEIQTAFQTVTLHDRLTFSPLEGERLELTCDAPGIPADERNLVYRAALALRERYGVLRGARVELEKRIPAEAGLGGGSSDAATALLGLAHLWKIPASGRELAELGARLGADVPFFLTGGTALGTGLGTEVTPFDDLPEKRLLIVWPGVKVSTAEAYKSLKAPALTKERAAAMLPISRAAANLADSLRELMVNDFEPVVFKIHPEIERARDALDEAGATGALLAGSGSSVFGMFDNKGDVERACVRLKRQVGWRVFPCATLRRSEFKGSFGACAPSW